MLSKHALNFPFFVPRIVFLLRNWPTYLYNYLGRRASPAEYRFRSGLRLLDTAGTLAGTIAVVFVRREYGQPRACEVIVDIGANMGCFSIYSAALSPKARIYCFEPEPRNYETLSSNIRRNALTDRILSSNSAVAATSGQREMIFGQSPLNSLIPGFTDGTREMVDCTTLHEVIQRHDLQNIDLLKINCEGAEYEILTSAAEEDLLRIGRIHLEYHNLHEGDKNGTKLAAYLKTRGFLIDRFTRYKDVSGFIWARREHRPEFPFSRMHLAVSR